MQEELHISSLVVHAVPTHVGDVRQAITRMPGALVHAATAEGKLVVTLERPSSEETTSSVQAIQQLGGVLTATLVYQCADTWQSMNQEIDDAQA